VEKVGLFHAVLCFLAPHSRETRLWWFGIR